MKKWMERVTKYHKTKATSDLFPKVLADNSILFSKELRTISSIVSLAIISIIVT